MADEKRTTSASRTEFAMQALSFADLFRIRVGAEKLTGPVTFSVELAAPEGPSTGGGKQAVQHVKLVPAEGSAVTVAGWANTVEKTAELRTYDHVAQLHGERFRGAAFPVSRTQYDALLVRMQTFFTEQGLHVGFAAPPAPRPAPAPARPPVTSSSLGLIFALVAVAAILVGFGVFMFLRARGG